MNTPGVLSSADRTGGCSTGSERERIDDSVFVIASIGILAVVLLGSDPSVISIAAISAVSTAAVTLFGIERRKVSVLYLAPDEGPDNPTRSEDAEDVSSNDIGTGSSPDKRSEPEENGEPEVEVIDGRTLAELLEEAGIVTETEAGDDLRLTDRFADVWHRRINRVRDGDRAVQQLALVLEVDPDKLVLEESDGTFIVRLDGNTLGKWPAEAAFLADVALYPTLGEWLPVWEELDGQSRDELLGRLRAFLEICPACDGDLQAFEEPDSDSGEMEVTLACAECGSVVFNGSY